MMDTRFCASLHEMTLQPGVELARGVSTASLSTVRIGGRAGLLIKVNGVKDLRLIAGAACETGAGFKVIGNGSNLLFPDKTLDKPLVLLCGEYFQSASFQGCSVTARAGMPLSKLVSMCAERGLAGMEGLIGVPGTVGGAVFMNASYRSSMADCLTGLEALDSDGSVRQLAPEETDLCYRRSSLGGKVILAATFKLKNEDTARIRERMKQFFLEKMAKQPMGEKTLGCVFKNPGKAYPPSGVLIEKAGMKGVKVGAAMVSNKHANFFVNKGGATSAQYLALMELVKGRVFDAFGVKLEPEIEVL